MDKTQENFRQKLKLSHISIYSKSGPCKTARFSSDSNGTSGRKNAEAVQERFQLIIKRNHNIGRKYT